MKLNDQIKKSRIIINIRDLNKLITMNEYLILMQNDIIIRIKKYDYINLINK